MLDAHIDWMPRLFLTSKISDSLIQGEQSILISLLMVSNSIVSLVKTFSIITIYTSKFKVIMFGLNLLKSSNNTTSVRINTVKFLNPVINWNLIGCNQEQGLLQSI